MRVFLTGGTGYIGAVVLDALHRAGHEVTALVRDARKAQQVKGRGAAPVVGSLGEPQPWADAAVGHEAYVHAAHDGSPGGADHDRRGLEALIAAARATKADRAVLFTSGVWVLGATREPATEASALAPIELAAWRPPQEQLVLGAAGIRPLVVRPGIVYGGSRGMVGDLLRAGTNGLIRVVGDGRNHWACVYDRDLAELYVRLLTTTEATGVFHANDEADETVGDIVDAIGRSVTHRPDVRYVPLDEARSKMGPLAGALALDQRVRSPRARALGWTPALRSVSGNVPRLFEEWRSGISREEMV